MVIAIIAILASMLLPALSKARAAAQSIKCTNNLKQIILNAIMYVNDNDDAFPVPTTATGCCAWSYDINGLPFMAICLKDYITGDASKLPTVDGGTNPGDQGGLPKVWICPSTTPSSTGNALGWYDYNLFLNPKVGLVPWDNGKSNQSVGTMSGIEVSTSELVYFNDVPQTGTNGAHGNKKYNCAFVDGHVAATEGSLNGANYQMLWWCHKYFNPKKTQI